MSKKKFDKKKFDKKKNNFDKTKKNKKEFRNDAYFEVTHPKYKQGELIEGTLAKHKRGFGFVTPTSEICEEDERPDDIFIAGRYLNGAMHGDVVEVLVFPALDSKKSREGAIQRIVQHGNTEIIGTFEKSKRFGFVVPDDKKFNNDDVFVRKSDWKNAQNGDKVVVQITKYPFEGSSAEGKITEIISRFGEPGGDIKALIRAKNLYQTFPSRVNAEAKAVARMKEQKLEGFEPVPAEEKRKRRDISDKTIITIDGADAKDLDDAISIEKLSNGNFLLGVHIADVSHYVEEEGPMDKEALKRGTSVYLVDQVIPMLPKALSNGICSLNEGVDRLTLSVDMEINSEGEVVKHDIYKSVINSNHRMVYDDVSDILELEDKEKIEKFKDIYDELLLMKELAQILNNKRNQRGSLDFDLAEAHISLDEQGIPVTIETAQRRIANRMIEEFMLAANETVAEHFYWMEIPFVYRVHETPAMDRMEEFKNFIKGFGIVMKGSTQEVHPRTLCEILEAVKDQSYEMVINTVMLRSMKKAFYGTECEGHFGLGVKYYCHFTSPIRRYPDLIIHRIIKESIDGKLDEERIKHYKRKVEEASELSSKAEREAQELEREVEKLKMTEYMSYHIGEEFEGVISGVTSFGFYVELPNTIEGLVRIATLRDDYYVHEVEKYRYIGEGTHKTYALGDKVKVQLVRASIEDKEIDFEVVEKL